MLNCSKTSLPCSVDGISGKDNIVNMWKSHFHDIFNCLRNSRHDADISVEFTNDMHVSVNDIESAIVKLDNNKSCGLDNIYAEHLKHASNLKSKLSSMMNVTSDASARKYMSATKPRNTSIADTDYVQWKNDLNDVVTKGEASQKERLKSQSNVPIGFGHKTSPMKSNIKINAGNAQRKTLR